MEVIKIKNGHRGSFNLFITPGKSVEIHAHRENGELINVRIFRPGDVAEYDSFNLSGVTNEIKQITKKNVIFNVYGKMVRLKMERFAWRNHDFDAAEKV